MLVKWDHFPRDRSKNKKMFETTTQSWSDPSQVRKSFFHFNWLQEIRHISLCEKITFWLWFVSIPFSSWWLVSTHLKNMRRSSWNIYLPQISGCNMVKINENNKYLSCKDLAFCVMSLGHLPTLPPLFQLPPPADSQTMGPGNQAIFQFPTWMPKLQYQVTNWYI